MAWLSPLDRRELSLILFCVTVFIVAYNLETSFRYFGVESVDTHAVLGRLGIGRSDAIDKLGRKVSRYRDKLESLVYGAWTSSGYIAGNGTDQGKELGGPYGSMWLGLDQIGDLRSNTLGQNTVDDGFRRWETKVPLTTLVKHVSGYTILNNVIIKNRTVYIVSDEINLFPPLVTISSQNTGLNTWHFISSADAIRTVGAYGGVIHGVTWMSTDLEAHNSTLFALWRFYASLDPTIDSSGNTVLPLPQRLIFPNRRFFTDPNPDFSRHWIRRRRVDTGFHPFLAKAAFPRMTELYLEDWEDYHNMEVPFVFERLVIADRSSAALKISQQQPIFQAAFEPDASIHWWEPIRRTLGRYFDYHDQDEERIITYIERQDSNHGPKLVTADHEALKEALYSLGKRRGYTVHVVSSWGKRTSWTERLNATVRSTIVLGVYSDDLYDAFYMKAGPAATLMEFFPPHSFSRDHQVIAQAMRLNYIAWWPDRKFQNDGFPTVEPPADEQVTIEVPSIISTIEDIFSRQRNH